MVELDSSIIRNANEQFLKMPSIADGMRAIEADRLRAQTLAEHNAAIAQQQAGQKLRMTLGELAARGKVDEAYKGALSAADFDAAQHFGRMQDDQRKAVSAKITAGAATLYGLRRLPPEQRKQGLLGAIPGLKSQGYTDEEILRMPLDDAGIDGAVTNAMSLKEQIDLIEKQKDRDLRAKEADATRDFQRGNAYIAAGLNPPGSPAPAAGGGTASADALRPHIVAQESGGNYRALNTESGALGAYQVMPQTAKSLAGQLGLPWRPDLMRSATPEGRSYQDRIGSAAIQEAVANGGGDITGAASYYHGGPDRSKWGPKTRQYAREIARRVERSASQPGSPSIIPGGKLDKPKSQRMTRSEIEAEPGLDPNLTYYRNSDGIPQLVSGQVISKPLTKPPTKALTDYQENITSSRNIEQALQLLDPSNQTPAAKDARRAIGPGTGMLGETFSQFNDPKGTDFRAMIGRIGGIIIKDTSGAAVSVSEDQRLKKWVPLVSDTVEAAAAKLRNLKNAINNYQGAFHEIYNQDNGYTPIRIGQKARPTGTLSVPNDISAIMKKYGVRQ